MLSIDPLDSSVATEVCLRVEVYGCDKIGVTAPVYPTPLLQYNLPEPSADSYDNLYTDLSYTGIVSGGFASGGDGILTDGTVGMCDQLIGCLVTDLLGRNAVDYPKDWLGWKRSVTREIEVVILFITTELINKVNIYFWEDSIVGMGGVRITDHNNNTINFDNTELSTITNNLKLLSFTMDTEVSVGYVRFSVSYAADRNVVLLTEIEIARHHSNLVTGRNVTQLSNTQHTLVTYNTTTIHGLSTNKTTNIPTQPTNSTKMPYSTTTELATVRTTTTITTTGTTTRTTTTGTTTTTTTIPTNVTNTTTIMSLATNRTRVSNTTLNTSTYQSYYTTMTSSVPTPCCDVSTVILAGVSSCLLLSLCVNMSLLLLLLWCCWRCLSRRGSLIVQGRDYTQDEGLYTPMSPIPVPTFDNVLDTETKQQPPGTPNNHYYRLDVSSYIPYCYSVVRDELCLFRNSKKKQVQQISENITN